MKKILKIVGIVLLVLLLAFVIFKIATYKDKPFKQVSISSTNIVVNTTNKAYLDTIVIVGLNELKVSGITIHIAELNNVIKKKLNDLDYQAILVNDNDFYVLYVGDYTRGYYIPIIAHELIHLKQYKEKKLSLKNNIFYWYDKEYPTTGILYTDRPWEAEAFTGQLDLSTKIRKVLY